jgi:hypothetical protein
MSRWKRVGLSFASALIADVMVASAVMLHDQPRIHFASLIFSSIAFLYLVIPGWLISLPVILFIEGNTRLKLFIRAAIGILIGPFVILSIALYAQWTSPSSTWAQGSMEFVYIATAISIIATTLYLTTLKLFSHPTPTPSS